jgi:extradiol dioxygenase family protein
MLRRSKQSERLSRGFASSVASTINWISVTVAAVATLAGTTPSACRAAEPATHAGVDKATLAKFIPATAKAGVRDQVTFLYYADLAAPRRFYGALLGLSPYYETPWVTLYRSAPHATIGVVKRPDDQVSAEAKRDAVMVSIVTDDVESWYQQLKRGGQVKFEKEIYDHPQVPIRAFLIRDPAGYSVEVFEWRDH